MLVVIVVIVLLVAVFSASRADAAVFGLFHRKAKVVAAAEIAPVLAVSAYETNISFGPGPGLRYSVTETRNVAFRKSDCGAPFTAKLPSR